MRTLCTFLLTAVAACAMAVTPGYPIPGVTASTTLGSNQIVVTGQTTGYQWFAAGQVYKVGATSGLVIVTSFTNVGNPATTSTTLTVVADDWTTYSAGATASGLTLTLYADYLEHAQLRVWFETDVGACASVWYDVASHDNSITLYQYRSVETSSNGSNGCTATLHAVDVIGISPATRWHFRANAKATYGTDNSAACKTDACGAVDWELTTPTDTHSSDGRPPLPTLPESVAAWLVPQPDTAGYTTIHVPEFAPTTGSINTGTSTLTLDTVPSGMAAGKWIRIAGGRCPSEFPAPAPWCYISTLVGSTATLNSNWVSDTGSNASHAVVKYTWFTIAERLRGGSLAYGTIIEFDQGHVEEWWDTDKGWSRMGFYLPGIALDDNASCSTHPCAIDDPAHRWIIIRTAATPATLPPPGTRTGPEYKAALGCIQAQDYAPAITARGGRVSMPTHHIRIENLCSVPLAQGSTEADPRPRGGFLEMVHGWDAPQYFVVDRWLQYSPDLNTRTWGNDINGKNVAYINSYMESEYWRPLVWHWGATISTNPQQYPSQVGATITFPGIQWQRNRDQAQVTQGAATITTTGTATGLVQIYFVMDATVGNGLDIRYTSGKGVTLTCGACRAVSAVADPTPTSTQKMVLYTEISNATSVFSGGPYSAVCTFGPCLGADSGWVTEGPNMIEGLNGHHWLVQNNFISGSNKGFFIDVGQYDQIKDPEHLTFRRNLFQFNQQFRSTSATWNGFLYVARHNGIEFKRGLKALIEGNDFVGGWANVNNGPSLLISETAYPIPVQGRVEDYTARYNLFRNHSESFSVNPHYTNTYSIQGANVSRVYFGHNLSYAQDAWIQKDGGPYFIGKTLLPCATDITVEHNTLYDTRSNLPIWQGCGEDRNEGGRFVNNIWIGNISAYGWLQMQRENTGLAPIPDVSYASYAGGATFDDAYASTFLRVNGTTATGNYAYKNNLHVCGSQQNAGPGIHDLLSETDFTASQCSTYKSRFGGLQSTNYFISSPDSKATRFSAVGWAAHLSNDFRYLSTSPYQAFGQSTDGYPLGVDVAELDRQRGIISNMHAIGTRAVGVGGCTGAGGTYCTTFAAIVPDKGVACYAAYGATGSGQTTWTLTAANTATTEARNIAVSGLAAGTYDWRMHCAGMPPVATQTFTAP